MQIVLLGNSTVGKTTLIVAYKDEKFVDPDPTVLAMYNSSRNFNGRLTHLKLYDTSGDPSLKDARMFTYEHTDCFMLCVAID